MMTQHEQTTVSGAVSRSSRGAGASVGAAQNISRSYEQCMQRHELIIEEQYETRYQTSGILADILWGSVFVAAGISSFAQVAKSENTASSIGAGFASLGIGGVFFFNGIRVSNYSDKTRATSRRKNQRVWREANNCGESNTASGNHRTEEQQGANSSSPPQRDSSITSDLEPCFSGTRCISSDNCLSGDICHEGRRECLSLGCLFPHLEKMGEGVGLNVVRTVEELATSFEPAELAPTEITTADNSRQTTFSLAEAAEIYGVSQAVVRGWITSGTLRAVQVGDDYRISRRALEQAWRDMGGGELFDD